MVIHSTDNTHSQATEGFSSNLKENENSSANSGQKFPGLTLAQVFNQDNIYDIAGIEMLSGTKEFIDEESKTPSFWSKLFAWWYQPDMKTQSVHTTATEIDLLDVSEVEPISPVPSLDEPDMIPPDLTAAQIPPHLKKLNSKEKDKLSHHELIEGLSHMSDRTIEEIMFIINMNQIELEKENANIAEGTFSKFQNFKKLHAKMLDEIKNILAKDEVIASRFNTAKKIAFAAAFVCGVAGAIITAGALPAAGAAVGAVAGATAANLFTTAVSISGSVGVPVTAALSGLASASNAYFKRRHNEDKAKHVQFSHHDKYLTDRIDDSRERLMATAEADGVFKERLINLMKRFNKMCKLVLDRS